MNILFNSEIVFITICSNDLIMIIYCIINIYFIIRLTSIINIKTLNICENFNYNIINYYSWQIIVYN